MAKYTITIEGDFEKGDCRKCPIGVASDIQKGKGVIYSCMYALGGGSKEFCPLEEVKQGEWVKTLDDVICSNCGVSANLDADEYFIRDKVRFDESNLCPNCGADMRGGKE